MSIASELAALGTDLSNAITSCKAAITNKGVSVPAGAKLSELPTCIAQISGGGESASVTFNNTYQSVTATVYLGDGTTETITIPTGSSTHTMTRNGCFLFTSAISGGGYWGAWSGGMLSGSGGGSIIIYSMTQQSSGEDTYFSAAYYGAAVTGETAAFDISPFSYV